MLLEDLDLQLIEVWKYLTFENCRFDMQIIFTQVVMNLLNCPPLKIGSIEISASS